MKDLRPADPGLFFTKNDPEDPRLGERAHPAPSDGDFHLLGWADDEGIRLNGGRPGAAEAPDRIRKFLYKMTPPAAAAIRLIDWGNLSSSGPLPQRHLRARELAGEALGKGFVLSLGGGHDYGFPDAAAFCTRTLATNERPLVVNFDAHLDVRPADGPPHSGTPFRRLLEEFGDRVDFFEVGLQRHCNSPTHAAWAEQRGARLLWRDSIREQGGCARALARALESFRNRPCWVSLDIDAVSSQAAPGCSQSWETGLSAEETLLSLRFLRAHCRQQGLGVYEVSPPLDQDDRTSKLAALFLYETIFPTTRADVEPFARSLKEMAR